MPKCKNDPQKTYKGSEPSPKGLGWCAHAETEGQVRRGLDQNEWVVRKTKNGTPRWVKKTKKLGKKYKTHDNQGRPFLVCVGKKEVQIFRTRDDVLIKSYPYKKVYIGKSPLTPMTKTTGGHGKDFVGNSILVHIMKNRYVFIGERVYEFTMQDSVVRFFSPVGNNDVPYPLLLGEKNVYFLLENKYMEKTHFPKMTNTMWSDEAYGLYWGKWENGYWSGGLNKKARAMKSIKIIQKKL